ncbi:MAG: FliO/MopB family protein [Alkalispirochaeta sp.]
MGVLWFSAHIVYSQSQNDQSPDDGSASEEAPTDDEASQPSVDSERAERPQEEDLVFSGGTSEGQTTPAPEEGEISAFGIWDLVRMVLVLLMVVGAVYGVVMLLRRRVGSEADDSDSPIRILASRNLGGNRDLHVVMIGKRVMLLGGGDSGVQLLTTVDDQETIDELVLAHSTANPAKRRTFGGLLGQWINNFTVPGTATPGSGSNQGAGNESSSSPDAGVAGGFFRTQQDRLRHMR